MDYRDFRKPDSELPLAPEAEPNPKRFLRGCLLVILPFITIALAGIFLIGGLCYKFMEYKPPNDHGAWLYYFFAVLAMIGGVLAIIKVSLWKP